jgi:hypothetical protein
MGSKRKFTGFWRVSAVSRQAAVSDWKFEVLVLNDCFHPQRAFAAVTTNVSVAVWFQLVAATQASNFSAGV